MQEQQADVGVCKESQEWKRKKEEKETTLARRGPIVTWLHLSLPVRRCSPQSWASQLVEDEDDSRHRCCSASPIFPHNLAAPSASINFICQRTQGRAGECVCVCAQSLGSPHFSFSHILSSVISLTFSLLRIQQHVHIKTSIIQASSS